MVRQIPQRDTRRGSGPKLLLLEVRDVARLKRVVFCRAGALGEGAPALFQRNMRHMADKNATSGI